MRILGIASLALVASGSAAHAVELTFGGEVKSMYRVIDNQRADADSLGPALCANTTLVAANFCGDSEGFVQSSKLTGKARGSNATLLEYGGDFEIGSDGKIDEIEVFAITNFGRFGIGTKKPANLSADRISVGESGVSTEPLGAERHEDIDGATASYGIAFGNFRGGFDVTSAGELGGTVLYEDETDNGLGYQLFARTSARDKVEVSVAPGVAATTNYKMYQYGAKLSKNDFTLAVSAGSDEGDNYVGTVNPSNSAAGLRDIERTYSNIAVAYKPGKLSFSADYDTGKMNAPWVPNSAVAGLNNAVATSIPGLPNSDREWDSYSVGMAYNVAPGLTFGMGYKVYDNLPVLNLDLTGTALVTSGLTLRKRTETAVSLKLNF